MKIELTQLAYTGLKFVIEFYVTESNAIPAKDFLDELPLRLQVKFGSLFALLADTGRIWNEKKFKHLTGSKQLFELKVDCGRIVCFFFSGRRVVLTHGFFKKGQKTPKGEIQRAEFYKKDFERRVTNA